MRKGIALILLIAAAPAAWSQSGGRVVEQPLSLEESILLALKNNLKLAADVLTPEISAAAARKAGEAFIPKLSFTYGKSNSNQGSFSWLDATDQVTTDYMDTQSTFTQLLPTGATLSADLYSYKNVSNRSFQTINPRYGSTLTFDIAQPLLRDFGFKMTRRTIIVARHGQEISERQLELSLMDTVTQVEEAYWALVFSRESLRVQNESLRLARDLLAKNTRELEVGTIPPLEVLSAKAEVASREADILQAEAEVKNREDALRTLLNLPRQSGTPAPSLVPTDAPRTDAVPADFEEAAGKALANRPELASSRVEIKTTGLNLSFARNQMLPDLRLRASLWSPGVSGTQIIYKNDDPLTGIVERTIPGGPSLAYKDAFRFRYKNSFVGLTLTLPLDTAISRAQFIQARLESRQAVLKLRDQEQQVLLEVQTVVRAVETDWKRVQAYRVARELADEKLKAEEKKLKAGLSTNYTVLQQQRDLAAARTNEIKAQTDYNVSLAKLNRATGETLRARNISLSGIGDR